MNKTLLLRFFCASLLGFYAPQSFPAEYTLQEVYELARERDPDLSIARYQVQGAEARKDISKGKLFPQISVFGDWSENQVRYEDNGVTDLPTRDYPGERYGLQLRTPLFNVRSLREYQRQSSLVDESVQQLAIAESQLLGRVVQVYLRVVLTEENLSQLQSELSALKQQQEEVEALYAKSMVPVTQVLETRTRLDTLRADVVNARGQAAIAKEFLTQLVGIQNLPLFDIQDSVALQTEIGDAERASMLALQADPAIAAATEALEAARKGVSAEKGSWWPQIDFVYNSQYSDVGFDNMTSPARNTDSYSVSVRYPLFEGGAGSARLRGAWSEYYIAQQRLEAARRNADGRARSAWVNLEAAHERVEASRQAVRTAEVNLDASRKAVRAGTARVTDVLLALAQDSRAQRDLSEAKFQKAMGWLELELATGANPETLAPIFSTALHGR